MTTGMKQGPTKETGESRKATNWAWAIAAIVVLLVLIAVALYTSHSNTNTNAPGATSGTEQRSGTGSQESVGHFPEQVIPGNGPNAGNNPTNPSLMSPSTAPQGTSTQGTSTATGTGTSGAPGSNAGSGNTGITTATDSVGGATPKGTKQSNPSPSPSEPGTAQF